MEGETSANNKSFDTNPACTTACSRIAANNYIMPNILIYTRNGCVSTSNSGPKLCPKGEEKIMHAERCENLPPVGLEPTLPQGFTKASVLSSQIHSHSAAQLHGTVGALPLTPHKFVASPAFLTNQTDQTVCRRHGCKKTKG